MMICKNCGSKTEDGAKFCAHCGAQLAVSAPTATVPVWTQASEETPNGRVRRFADGKYRWVYAMSLFKNPTIFLLVWKIFFFIFLGIFALIFIMDLVNQGTANLMTDLKILGYLLFGMTAVVGLGYLFYAAIMGGEYVVVFEMDENGVNHKQIDAQAKKAKRLGQAAMVAGAAVGRLSTAAVGINAQRTEMYSAFAKVRKVKAYPRSHTIKVNGRLSHNQVYAPPEDFDFVREYIVSHCENLKK